MNSEDFKEYTKNKKAASFYANQVAEEGTDLYNKIYDAYMEGIDYKKRNSKKEKIDKELLSIKQELLSIKQFIKEKSGVLLPGMEKYLED